MAGVDDVAIAWFILTRRDDDGDEIAWQPFRGRKRFVFLWTNQLMARPYNVEGS